MNAIAIGAVVLACVFGGALLGIYLRTVLPEHHLSDASKDVVRLVTGLLATLAALVLGLLIASAKNSFDSANEGFRQSAARIVLLDRALAQFGPATHDLRESLRARFAERIDQLFSKDRPRGATLESLEATGAMEALQRAIRALAPQDDTQRALQSRALALSEDVVQTRWLGIENAANGIPAPFLVVLVFWLTAMFAGFGLFAPRNAVAVSVLFLGALSLSAAIFLVEELNDPLGGLVAISRAPLDTALANLGR